MKKIRILGILMCVVIAFSFVLGGCGKSTDSVSPQEQPEPKAQDEQNNEPAYPVKPITYLCPFPAGGINDIMMRRQQPLLEKVSGVKYLIEYKGGAAGAVGWSHMITQKPDGYYIASINIPHIILQPHAADSGYQTEDIVPVAFTQATPNGIAVPKDSPFNTLADLIQYAKENPGKVTIGGTGTNSGHHVATMEFMKAANIEVTYVPFTGSAPQMTAVMGGHTTATFGNSTEFFGQQDKLKVLAIGSKERMEALPDIPTFAEQGYEIYPAISRGVGVPPGTPRPVIEKLEKIFLEVVTDSEFQRDMTNNGSVTLTMGHEESKQWIAEMQEEYIKLMDSVTK
ncbi:MAG: tripartite tricarboxylate transporter substrate binding protein [Peptococcaceae bacterium]